MTRVLTHKFSNGLFDEGPTDVQHAIDTLNSPGHRQLARVAAQQSIVMLINNERTLPVEPSQWNGMDVALLGPTASSECNCSDAVW